MSVWPCPVNPLTQDLNVSFDLSEDASSVKFMVYTMGYRLIREVELGSYPAGMQEGKVKGNYLLGLGNGIYLYYIDASLVDGTKQRGGIREFILLK